MKGLSTNNRSKKERRWAFANLQVLIICFETRVAHINEFVILQNKAMDNTQVTSKRDELKDEEPEERQASGQCPRAKKVSETMKMIFEMYGRICLERKRLSLS